jgi:predicted phosphodiesterase
MALAVLPACGEPATSASSPSAGDAGVLSFDSGSQQSGATDKTSQDAKTSPDAASNVVEAATVADVQPERAEPSDAAQGASEASDAPAVGDDTLPDAAQPDDASLAPPDVQDTAPPAPDINQPEPDLPPQQPDVLQQPDTTPPPVAVVKFAAVGDTGKGNDTQYKVGAAIAAKCKQEGGCDFVMLLGDNFYQTGVSSENDGQFKTKFEDPYKDVDAPFFVVLGNHDYGGEGAGYELWKGDSYKKYSKKNAKFVHPDNVYDKVVKHVHLFAMDSNLMMYGLGKPQIDKLKPLITASTATWKINFAHHPYLSNGKHGNAGTYEDLPAIPIVSGDGVKKGFEEIVCGKVDVLISGHDHSRQWIQKSSKCSGTELIIAGAGASTTEIKTKQNIFNELNPAHYADATVAGFFFARIEGKKFHGEFLDETGKVSFARDFAKP